MNIDANMHFSRVYVMLQPFFRYRLTCRPRRGTIEPRRSGPDGAGETVYGRVRMKYGIGIDTGGTYTDAVIYDFEEKKVLSAAKSLTTKGDLSRGIIGALDGLDPALRSRAEVIALSTTLATNACVENKGGRAKLIFIGVDGETMARVGKSYGFTAADELFFCPGSGSFDGKILPSVDYDALLHDTADWVKDAEGLGVVEMYAMNNGAVAEREAKRRLTEATGLPVVCGSELFSGLNSLQRGTGTLLNARLVPVITDFIASIKTALAERAITAPIVIVRSDGSLMSEAFSRSKPVETILCGPAASVLGGMRLADRRDCVIIDMGGTTTDVSLVKGGEPVRAGEGVQVGEWRTFVRGVFIDTFGLGGDSAVRPAKAGFELDTRRVVPISLLAKQYPHVKEELRALLRDVTWHTRPIYEYYTLLRPIEGRSGYTESEKVFCRALAEKPLLLREAAAAAGTDIYHLEQFERLEAEGVVIRAGLTPTDFMHLNGDFDRYDTEAARLAASFLMRSLGYDDTDEGAFRGFVNEVYEAVKRKLYRSVVRILLQDKYPRLRREGLDGQLMELVDRSWAEFRAGKGPGFFSVAFPTQAALVGIGAPIHIFLPDVAKALGADCVIPENAAVANAVGAVVGNVNAEVRVEIRPNFKPDGIDGYFVESSETHTWYKRRDDAAAEAEKLARALVETEARARGIAGEMSVTLRTEQRRGTSTTGSLDLGSVVIANALGGAVL